MKALRKIIYAGVLLSLASCSEDYLEVYPTEVLTDTQVAAAAEINEEVAKGTLLGIYENMYRFGSGGTTAQEDFGVTAQFMQMDISCLEISL